MGKFGTYSASLKELQLQSINLLGQVSGYLYIRRIITLKIPFSQTYFMVIAQSVAAQASDVTLPQPVRFGSLTFHVHQLMLVPSYHVQDSRHDSQSAPSAAQLHSLPL